MFLMKNRAASARLWQQRVSRISERNDQYERLNLLSNVPFITDDVSPVLHLGFMVRHAISGAGEQQPRGHHRRFLQQRTARRDPLPPVSRSDRRPLLFL